MEQEEISSCHDDPSSLDFSFGAVETDTGFAFPDAFAILPPSIYDQGEKYVMRMSCTRCSVKHVVDAQNYELEKYGQPFTPVDVEAMWTEWLKDNPQCEAQGDSLQNGPKQAVSLNYISGFAAIHTIEEAKTAIYTGRLIATGSRNGNWAKVRENHVYELRTDGKNVGHAFCIVGWNQDGFLCINSYGDSNGVFSLPYSLWDTTYSKMALFDLSDEKTIKTYKTTIMSNISIADASKAYEAKIWNGERPQEPVTREEAAAMVYRASIAKTA